MGFPSLSILTGGSVTPEKLIFTPMSKDLKEKYESFSVMFNPNSYSIAKGVSWNSAAASDSAQQNASDGKKAPQRGLDASALSFGGGQNRILTLNLFYDVTEQSGRDVREETDKIVALTRINRDESCPRPCEISWGGTGSAYDFPFKGVITNLVQQFTLFSPAGIPLRANLTVTVTEYAYPEENLRQTDPEMTSRIVKRGDTLASISAELYKNPAMWRVIAEANDIDNPYELKTGIRLTIPKV